MSAPVRVTDGTFSEEYLNWRRLRTALETSGGDPSSVVLRLRELIRNDAWRSLKSDDGRPFPTFKAFVQDDSKGLNIDATDLVRLLQVRGSTEKSHGRWDAGLFSEVREDVTRLLAEDVEPARQGAGRPAGNPGGTRITQNDGLFADSILARLKRDDPDMAQQVINGTVTANAAAQQKGWRKPRILLTNPESVAAQIRKHWTDEQIEALKEALT